METFGKRTVLLRKNLGLTQKEFAKAGDFSQSNLSLLENDGVIPNLGFILKISSEFPEVNLNWWLMGRESMFLVKEESIDLDPNISPSLKKFLNELKQSVDNVRSVNKLVRGNKD